MFKRFRVWASDLGFDRVSGLRFRLCQGLRIEGRVSGGGLGFWTIMRHGMPKRHEEALKQAVANASPEDVLQYVKPFLSGHALSSMT